MEERIPPQNIEAEQSVLGAMFVDREAIARVSEILLAEDFYREAHKVIYRLMLELFNRNEAVDYITVTELLNKNNKLEDVGGLAYVMSLTKAVATAANVKYHADIVKDKSQLRQMIRAGTEIAAMGYNPEDELPVLMDRAEKLVLDIANGQNQSDFSSIKDIAMDVATKISGVLENKGGLTGIPTGFTDLDKLTSGLQPSDFIILAARPSMGKTAFALNIVQNVALRAHTKMRREKPLSVAFFSLEMSKEQLVSRMLCSEGNIDSQRLRVGELSNDDWARFWETCNVFSNASIFIDDTPGITAMEMRSRARRLKAEHGLDLIVVDYLQLMQGSGKRNSLGDRQQEVSEISRSLKALARELNVPLISLSQLSRGVEARQVKRPMLSDLRESGSLEQDADIVAFLYREDYYNPETENKHTELIIAKHRNGPVDTVNLFFHKQFTKFVGFTKMQG